MRPARVVSFGSLPPEWGGPLRGGVATAHATLTEALSPGRDPGAEVVAVVTGSPGAPGAPVRCHAPEADEDRREFLSTVLQTERPDVALLHHVHLAWGVLLPELAPALPLVGIAHSWHSITLLEDADERGRAQQRVQRALDHLRVLIVASDHTRREGLALGLRYPRDTRVLHYPLQPAFVAPMDVAGPRGGIGYTASLVARKNPGALLRAVAMLDDVRLDMVGEGSEAGELAASAEALDVGARVRFHGGLLTEHLCRLMAGWEVMCVPSHSESFGIAYIEALACGTPVVGFGPTVREIRNAIGVEIGVGIDRTSPESIAAAIEKVRSTDWDRELLRSATVRAFDTTAIAHRYASALDDAAGPRGLEHDELARRVASLGRWHYEIDLGEGVVTPIADPSRRDRHEQRRRVFFEPLVEACGGSLAGRRVLDLGCNAGFWSLCALEAGCASVVGVDGRPEHVEQARLVCEARRIDPARYEFRHADVFAFEPGERFDVVLCLGLLYHVDRPLELFERLAEWTREWLVVDTAVAAGAQPGFELWRESSGDPRNTIGSQFVLRPTPSALLELGAAHGFASRVFEPDVPAGVGMEDYRDGRRLAVLYRRDAA